CTDMRYAKDYKLRDIIGIAYKNLIWDRAHIPQIAMFFAVGAFLFFIALSLVTLLMGLSVNVANAAAPAGNAANDVLNNIFNLNGNNLIPTAFGGMLAVYANLILVLAGIILFWTITSAVVETMREGKPLGKSFNGTWTPVRLVFGLGLLIPLSSGLNSGQYITLYLAKWGSDVATTVFQKFTTYLSMGQGITISQIPPGKTQKTLEDLFNLSACVYKARINNIGIEDPKVVIEAALQDLRSGSSTKEITLGGDKSFGNQTGCGAVTFAYYENPSNAEEQIKNNQLMYFLRYAPDIIDLADNFISHMNPQSSNYFQAVKKSTYGDRIKEISDSYHKIVETGILKYVEDYNKNLSDQLTRDLNNSGWVMAPMYFHRLIEANIRVGDAANSFPQSSDAPRYSDMFLHFSNVPEEPGSSAMNVDLNPLNLITNKLAAMVNDLSTSISSAFGITIFTANNPLIALVIAGRLMVTVASVALVAWTVVAGAIGFTATVGTNIVLAVGGLMTMIIMLIFSTGLMLGYILPLIPLTRFIFGVLGWLMMVLIAVVGMPLFALAHLRAGGEGFVGQLQVQSAYNMLIGIIVRPTLIVIGLILAMVIFREIVAIAGPLFMGGLSDINAAVTSRSYTGANLVMALTSLFGAIFLMQVFTSLFIALANACFKLIDIVPSQAMTWMGTGAQQSPAEGGADEFANLAKQDGQTLQQVGMKAPEARGYAKGANQLLDDRDSKSVTSDTGDGGTKPKGTTDHDPTSKGRDAVEASQGSNSSQSNSSMSQQIPSGGEPGGGDAGGGSAGDGGGSSSGGKTGGKSLPAPQSSTTTNSAGGEASKQSSSQPSSGGEQASGSESTEQSDSATAGGEGSSATDTTSANNPVTDTKSGSEKPGTDGNAVKDEGEAGKEGPSFDNGKGAYQAVNFGGKMKGGFIRGILRAAGISKANIGRIDTAVTNEINSRYGSGASSGGDQNMPRLPGAPEGDNIGRGPRI
ncbi:MAG TPA: DotA/TraY family protein, partial [Alphaproteobacteria bacterium]|nr:DotA/TraY family protein [Alphaproteobacteria bacterium]